MLPAGTQLSLAVGNFEDAMHIHVMKNAKISEITPKLVCAWKKQII